jgi:rare lipoprotein A
MEICMSSINRARRPYCFGSTVRLGSAVATATLLAACAQSPVVTEKPSPHLASRSTLSNVERKSSREVGILSPTIRPAPKHDALLGMASYYEHGSLTASGEKFDARELTAAHPTLPFGTRLRVTNLATGRSVMVRVNDRGPFVRGRVVDVSYTAARTLGMVGRGIAKVKLDVVHEDARGVAKNDATQRNAGAAQ